jgi:hypothetical protein
MARPCSVWPPPPPRGRPWRKRCGKLRHDADGVENVDVLPIAQMPPDWKDYPFPESIQEHGRRWLEAQAKAILKVPSVVVPQQHHNYIVNPLHPDFHSFKIGAAVENRCLTLQPQLTCRPELGPFLCIWE